MPYGARLFTVPGSVVQVRRAYDDGATALIQVPYVDVGRSGDDIDVKVYLAKKNVEKIPTSVRRTGRKFDERTGERI